MEFEKLTEREIDVLLYYSQGFSAQYVADRLYLSKKTVEVHIRHIYEKLQINNRDRLIEVRPQFLRFYERRIYA